MRAALHNSVVIVAGGTGGHINAALALGERLARRGHSISYLSGQRPLDLKLFQGLPVTHLGSWPLRTTNPLRFIMALARNLKVFVGIFVRFVRQRPRFVVGCGGYVCGPTLLAGKLLGVPVYIIEQNAVLGLTNKLLARFSDLIFTHFRVTRGLPAQLQYKVRVVGNPTRQSIVTPPLRTPDGTLRVLVFGGSLGAQQVNEVVRAWAAQGQAYPVSIIHQTGPGDQPAVLAGHNVQYKALPYLERIEDQYAWCDVIVARAGASTVSELRIVRRPSLLIPFPKATDNHQWWNALELQGEDVCPVDVVDPALPAAELLKKLGDFMGRHAPGQGVASHSGGPTVDSAETCIQEIYRHVGFVQNP
jgi:UDP-N-acetylglucosamine--N-acetylmuramyl-(pentapeptide) pyrophosphoryl-undecaprenol N-acetylglucosamine transferase